MSEPKLSACPWPVGKRLWKEDETLRYLDGERLSQAWERLFGERYIPGTTCAKFDGGDHFGYLMLNGATVVHSYDGDEIWAAPEPAWVVG